MANRVGLCRAEFFPDFHGHSPESMVEWFITEMRTRNKKTESPISNTQYPIKKKKKATKKKKEHLPEPRVLILAGWG